MQRTSILCDVTMISHCWLMCSRLIIVSVQYKRTSVTHCQTSLTVTLAEESELMSALWHRSIQSALIAHLSATLMINAQQSLWSLLSHSLRDLMLLFCAHISMMIRETAAHCKSVFFTSLLIAFFLFVTTNVVSICCIYCCLANQFQSLTINLKLSSSLSHYWHSLHSLQSLFNVSLQYSISMTSANSSSSEKLIEAFAVLSESTAHTLCILNTH